MVSNTTNQTLNVRESIEWHGRVVPAQSLVLTAHQTLVVDIEKLLKNFDVKSQDIEAGGISITHNGPPGAVIAHGVILNKEARFASNLHFRDPAAQPTSVLNGTGLMLGRPASATAFPGLFSFVPRLALRNAGASAQTVHVTVDYTLGGNTHSEELPQIELAPHEVRVVHLNRLVESLGNASIDDAGIEVHSTGLAGSLIAELTSIDKNNGMSVDVPLTSISAAYKGTGAHPFHLQGNSQAILHLRNLAAERTTAIVQILHADGEFSPELIRLEPRQSLSIDLRSFRDTGAKDIHGHQLPADLSDGEVQWFQRGRQIVIGRLVASNPSFGVAANFSCGGVCCPPSFFSFSIDPGVLDGIPENDFTMTMYETDYTCGVFYGPYNVTAYVSTFSADPGIASVIDGNVVEMVDEGLTTINIDHWATTFEEGFTECESGPCERNCNETDNLLREVLEALVRIPHHLVVVGDSPQSGCGGAVERPIKYRVVDRNGRTITAPMRLKEHFISISQNTCGNGQPGASPCSSGYVIAPSGEFFDFLTVNCNDVGGSCGYDLNWQWQWCPARRAALPLGTFNGHVRHNEVKVNGNTTGFPPGTEIFP